MNNRLLIGLICALGLATVFTASAQTMDVAQGKVSGLSMADGSRVFYAIPYAEAPSGDLRWKPPLARKPWQGVFDASKPGSPCVQADYEWNRDLMKRGREDCLSVSLRTPSLGSAARLPVLVYIHGGSNGAGDANGLDEDGLHRLGIVVVKIQYRLGVFGFLGLEALAREDTHKASGNYALQDQIEALKWVRSNISAFGGDPGNITVTGNSAGGFDALMLTLSPLSQGLFQKAIIQAGAPGAPITAKQNAAIGKALMKRLSLPANARGLKRLRALPTDQILAAAKDLPVPQGVDPSFLWEMQILDGYVMPHDYSAAYAKGMGKSVPIIIGSNTQELGGWFKPEAAAPMIRSAYGKSAPEAMVLYGLIDGKPPAPDPVLGSTTTQVMTDMWFRCPVNWLSERMARNSPAVWRYEFGFGAPGSGKPPEHTSEMAYIYQATPAKALTSDWPPIQRYWANFIRTGDPNGTDLPFWPQVGGDQAYLRLEPQGISAAKALRHDLCDLMYRDRDYPASPVVEPK